jgi:predicted PurR-regulated permease PerM
MSISLPPSNTSPPWPQNLKLVIGLTFMGAILGLLIYFRSIIGPLLLAFIVSYLLHPVVGRLHTSIRLSWRAAAGLIFLLLLIILIGLSTATGVVIVQQIQSLFRVVQRFTETLPELMQEISTTVYTIGPFKFDLGQYLDFTSLGNELLKLVEPLIGRIGTLVGSLASGAATTIGWGFFSLLISYFILADIGQVPDPIQFINIPGYTQDIRILANKLGRIWNAYLRGQMLIVGMVMVVYFLMLTILNVRYAIGIAIIVGLARFIPYVGPFIMYGIIFLVTFFQGTNYLALEPFTYSLLVIAISFIFDQIFDNLVSPRILGQSLGVHPAAVLVAAIISANLIGIIGVVLAAPVLASLQLVGQYVVKKMFDQEPWPEEPAPPLPDHERWFKKAWFRLRAWWRLRRVK